MKILELLKLIPADKGATRQKEVGLLLQRMPPCAPQTLLANDELRLAYLIADMAKDGSYAPSMLVADLLQGINAKLALHLPVGRPTGVPHR